MRQITDNRLFWVAACAFSLLTAAFVVLVTVPGSSATAANMADNIGQLVASLVASGACAATARRLGQRRKGWALLAMATLFTTCSQAVWCYYDLLRGAKPPSFSIGDAFELLAVPVAVAGLLTLSGARGASAKRLRNLLDSTLIGSAVLFISWTTALSAVFRHPTGGALAQATNLAYPVGDIVVASLVLILATQFASHERTSFALVSAGFLCFTVADSSFAYLNAVGRYGNGGATDTGWVLGYFFVALGAIWACLHHTPAGGGPSRATLWTIFGPYLPLAGAGAAAVWRVARYGSLDRSSQVTVVIVVLIMTVRQFVVLFDNLALTRRLEAKVERRTAELHHQEFHDGLTGLANRALFSQFLDNAVQRQARSGAAVAVVVIDLYDFTRLNDMHGFQVGDDVLCAVGARLQATVRASDTVARIGGDEFALLLEGPPSAIDVERTAGRLILSLARPLPVGSRTFSLEASIGIALDEAGDSSGDELARNAGLAMHAAKARGGHCYEVYVPQVHSAILERMRIEAELRRAVDNEEFVVYYQAVVDLATEAVQGVEALVRWQHPQRGLLTPDKFIALAEKTGLIVAIGAWVLRQACCDIQALENEAGPLALSVNLSARQLEDPDLIAIISRALQVSGFDPHRLTLEVTESAIMADVNGAVRVLAALRELGTKVAIDDFGTGYSSLGALRDLPVDTLKIDRSFIINIAHDRASADLTRRTLQLAADFHLHTVAEGVEDPEQLDILRSLGCDSVQGFIFSRPKPIQSVRTSASSAQAGA